MPELTTTARGGEGGSWRADDIVVTVSTTIDHGTVVCWYRNVLAAEHRWPMVSASAGWVRVGEHLTRAGLPPGVMARAELVHQLLERRPDADLSGWATHRRTVLGDLERVATLEEARRG